MWKVIFESPYQGGEPSIYLVQATNARDAERVARGQTHRYRDTDADQPLPVAFRVLSPDDLRDQVEIWPRPQIVDGMRVHTFDTSSDGYNQTQYRPDIHDGDVLWVPTERVAGYLMQAWPTAVSINCGNFHQPATDDLIIDGHDYTHSAGVAASLLAGRPWTATIAGPERHDGEAPYVWVVQADTRDNAIAKAFAAHLANAEEPQGTDPGTPDAYGEPTYRLVSITSGLPGRYDGTINDARPGASECGEHDCLAVEDLRARAMAWAEHSDQHTGGQHPEYLHIEAAQIVRHLASILQRGLA